MPMTRTVVMAMLVAAAAANANAQTQPPPANLGFVNISFGTQPASRIVNVDESLPLYGETATVAAAQEIGGGAVFDISGGYRIKPAFGVALGFTNFPPPAPDPCITQVLSLQSQLNSLGAQITAIEAQYPRGIPSSIYDSYVAMVNQYNSLVSRRNALPCDAS